MEKLLNSCQNEKILMLFFLDVGTWKPVYFNSNGFRNAVKLRKQ